MTLLDKLRDELAQQRADDSISPHTTIYDVRAGFDAGFTAGAAHERARAEGLVEALVTIECGLVTTMDTAKYAGFKSKEIARDALGEYKRQRGET